MRAGCERWINVAHRDPSTTFFSSLLGALVGAVIVAAAEVLAIHYVDPLLSDVVPFLVLIAALIVRPWGLFGTREELDRV